MTHKRRINRIDVALILLVIAAAGMFVFTLIANAHEVSLPVTEAEWNDFMCEVIGGEREVQHYFEYGEVDDEGNPQESYIMVDCETDYLVIEGGLDKRSSLDGLQQAVFAGVITGKVPAVVIYDTDGVVGSYETRIEAACEAANVAFFLIIDEEDNE